jgi:hypothetical protein
MSINNQQTLKRELELIDALGDMQIAQKVRRFRCVRGGR